MNIRKVSVDSVTKSRMKNRPKKPVLKSAYVMTNTSGGFHRLGSLVRRPSTTHALLLLSSLRALCLKYSVAFRPPFRPQFLCRAYVITARAESVSLRAPFFSFLGSGVGCSFNEKKKKQTGAESEAHLLHTNNSPISTSGISIIWDHFFCFLSSTWFTTLLNQLLSLYSGLCIIV